MLATALPSLAPRPSAPDHQEIAQLQQARAQPLPFSARELRERSGEHSDLIRLDAEHDLALRGIARGGEERRGGHAEHFRETREHRCAWLFDAPGFELGDRAPRYADTFREVGLREAHPLPSRAHQKREGLRRCRPAGHDRELTP